MLAQGQFQTSTPRFSFVRCVITRSGHHEAYRQSETISDQSGQNCLTFIFFDHAGLVSAPGAMSTASITKSRQPTKSWSGARVAVHGTPPFTFPVRRSDFFGTALAPS